MSLFGRPKTPPAPPMRMLVVFDRAADEFEYTGGRSVGHCVEHDGDAIDNDLRELGSYAELGVRDPVPPEPGPFVWEGRVRGGEYSLATGDYDGPEYKGAWRRLTPEEGALFLQGKPIFDTHRRFELCGDMGVEGLKR